MRKSLQIPVQKPHAFCTRKSQNLCLPREGRAHLGRRGPGWRRLNCLLLLVLFLLELLGQFQVAKTQHALWLLLLL